MGDMPRLPKAVSVRSQQPIPPFLRQALPGNGLGSLGAGRIQSGGTTRKHSGRWIRI